MATSTGVQVSKAAAIVSVVYMARVDQYLYVWQNVSAMGEARKLKLREKVAKPTSKNAVEKVSWLYLSSYFFSMCFFYSKECHCASKKESS